MHNVFILRHLHIEYATRVTESWVSEVMAEPTGPGRSSLKLPQVAGGDATVVNNKLIPDPQDSLSRQCQVLV